MKTVLVTLLLIAVLGALAQVSPRPASAENVTPTIREDQDVTVGGVTETWRLQWKSAPKPYCGSEPEGAFTCPCTGFAYGESGDLYLIRQRGGVEIDRLHLTPVFRESPAAVLQRWLVDYKRDVGLAEHDDFAVIVSKRAKVQAMHFADYDHDGEPTEFYLQTEAVPCGKSVGVVVGVSRSNPRLHVFGTASNPDKPLYLQKHEWEALRHASSASVEVLDWSCGDHGADTQTELELGWSASGIDGVRREYTCPAKDKKRRLISARSLSH